MKDLKSSYSNHSGEYIKNKGYKFTEYSIDPKKLKPNPKNPYKELDSDTYRRLKSDIETRGIIDPLIVDENLILLTGHNRLRIALELKLNEVPIRKISTLSEPEKNKLMVLDNLLRRQLSPEEKKALILRAYGKELKEDNRGGDRKSKIKSSNELLKSERNLAKKIEKETGIKEGTAKRLLSEIRNETKPKIKSSNEPLKSGNKTLDETIKTNRKTNSQLWDRLEKAYSGECKFDLVGLEIGGIVGDLDKEIMIAKEEIKRLQQALSELEKMRKFAIHKGKNK